MIKSNMNGMDIVEEALQTWPVAQTPAGFSGQVLQRIEAVQYAKLRFQFTWLDYALGLFTVSATFLAFFVWKMLPDLFIMQLTYRLFVLWNVAEYQTVLVYFLFGIGGFLAFILFTAIMFAFPIHIVKKSTVLS